MKGPYLFIAFACRSIPQDGKMPVENLPGKINVEGSTETMPPFTLTFTLFMGFTAGEYTGKAKVDIQPLTPSNEELPPMASLDVEFQEPLNHRVHVKVLIEDLVIQQRGIYWFDVTLNKSPMARIPVEVSYRQIETVSSDQDAR